MRPEYPGRAPKARLWRHTGASVCVRRRRSRRPFTGCLGGFHRLVTLSLTAFPGPLYSGLPQSSPPLRDAPWLSLLRSLLRRWVRSTAGAAILYLLSNPDVGGLPSASPGLSVVSLTDPPLTRTPRPRDNGGSHLVCLQSDPH